jgi:hypothetical protein
MGLLDRIIDSSCKEQKCKKLFGSKQGKKLFRAMIKISEKGFAVSTTDKADEVVIAKNHSSGGRILRFPHNNYDLLIMPNDQIRAIRSLSYMDIKKYL